MKKVLFATTALVATAGVAAADVTLSGSAEMGIVGGDAYTGRGADGIIGTADDTTGVTQFHTDIDVTFTLSGSTDNGLTFGANFDLDEVDGSAGIGPSGPDGSVFLSGNFGTITMGDTDGAFDWAMNEVPAGPGSINDAETTHGGFNGNAGFDEFFRGGDAEGHILRYDHSVGALAFAVSIEIDDESFTVLPAPTDTDPVIGLGVRYDVNLGGADMEIALGYQTMGVTVGGVSADPSIMGISLDTNVSGLNLGLNYSVTDWDIVGFSDTTHVGIGVGYSMDAISFGLNWGRFDDLGGVAGDESSGFGLSAGYDLGGGASVLFGYSTTDMTIGGVNADSNIWSLGLSMSF